jgi:outer membrane biosynthesis protein TonB
MQALRVFAICVVFAATALAQKTKGTKPCIAADEQVYRPGIDGVKPPQMQPQEKGTRAVPDIHGPVTLELLVNSEGQICSVKAITAQDPLDGKRAADHVLANWKFRPATQNGTPVAVQLTVNFGPPRLRH